MKSCLCWGLLVKADPLGCNLSSETPAPGQARAKKALQVGYLVVLVGLSSLLFEVPIIVVVDFTM